MRAENAVVVLDIGFGTGTLTTKLYDEALFHLWGGGRHQEMTLCLMVPPNAHLYQGDFSKGLPNHCGTFVMTILFCDILSASFNGCAKARLSVRLA